MRTSSAKSLEISYIWKKDRPFSPVLLQDSIEALVISKKFSAIDVDSKDVSGGMVVHFSLVPYRYVKRLDIHGRKSRIRKQNTEPIDLLHRRRL